MKTVRHAIEFLAVRSLDFLLSLVPWSMALRMGEMIGRTVGAMLESRRTLALRNLTQAFPDMSEAEKNRIYKGVWSNVGKTAIEFLRIRDLQRRGFDRTVRWEGAEHLERALALGKGVVLLTAHFSNWEMTGVLIQHRFKNMMAIYRVSNNPWVDRWILNKRTISGMHMVAHRQAVKASLRWLKDKGIVGILFDQNLYTGGVFAPLFGRPAATTPLPGLLHVRTGAPILLTYSLRDGDGFRMVVEPPIEWTPAADPAQEIQVITEAINRHLESLVRRYPHLWFWIHNRWKRQPEPVA